MIELLGKHGSNEWHEERPAVREPQCPRPSGCDRAPGCERYRANMKSSPVCRGIRRGNEDESVGGCPSRYGRLHELGRVVAQGSEHVEDRLTGSLEGVGRLPFRGEERSPHPFHLAVEEERLSS